MLIRIFIPKAVCMPGPVILTALQSEYSLIQYKLSLSIYLGKKIYNLTLFTENCYQMGCWIHCFCIGL